MCGLVHFMDPGLGSAWGQSRDWDCSQDTPHQLCIPLALGYGNSPIWTLIRGCYPTASLLNQPMTPPQIRRHFPQVTTGGSLSRVGSVKRDPNTPSNLPMRPGPHIYDLLISYIYIYIPGEPKRIGIHTSMLITSKIIKLDKFKRHHFKSSIFC